MGRHRVTRVYLVSYLVLVIALIVSLVLGIGAVPVSQATTPIYVRFARAGAELASSCLPEGPDFATLEIGDPWDMENDRDIVRTCDLTNVSVSNGIWSGRSTTDDPSFYLLDQGYYGAYHVNARDGYVHPISTTLYCTISFRMYLDWPSGTPWDGQRAQLFYFYNDLNLTDYAASNCFQVEEGWHVYTLDLHELGCLPGKPRPAYEDWVKGLRLDPIAWPNTEIKIDWVRLTGQASPESIVPIEWVVPPGTTVDLYLDTDSDPNNGQDLIAAGLPGTSSYNWDTSILPPGDHYIHVVARLGQQTVDTYTQGPFVVNQAPRVKILTPSMTSGEDYAAAVLKNAWDMNSLGDVKYTEQLCGATVADGIYTAQTCNGYNDSQIWTLKQGTTPIDTARYRYVTYRLKNDHAYPLNAASQGWISRIVWKSGASVPSVSNDFYLYPGWNTLSLDLYEAELDDNNLYPTATLWKNSSPTDFRLDPNEIANQSTVNLDYIKLTARDEADTAFDICWEYDDPGDDVSFIVSYVPVAEQGQREVASGTTTPIAAITPDGCKIPASQPVPALTFTTTYTYTVYLPAVMYDCIYSCNGATCFTWNTSWMTPTAYYIVITATDECNVTVWRSESPLVIRH